jgi:hypothetical protein
METPPGSGRAAFIVSEPCRRTAAYGAAEHAAAARMVCSRTSLFRFFYVATHVGMSIPAIADTRSIPRNTRNSCLTVLRFSHREVTDERH